MEKRQENIMEETCSVCNGSNLLVDIKHSIKICSNCGKIHKIQKTDNVIDENNDMENDNEACITCGHVHFVSINVEATIVCDNCGTVKHASTFIEQKDEHLNSLKSDDHTFQSPFDDNCGNVIPKNFRAHVYIDGKLTTRSMDRYNVSYSYNHEQRVYYNFSIVVSSLNEQLNLTVESINTSKFIFCEFIKSKKIIRANVRIGLKAACIYIACKIHKAKRDKKKICRCLSIELTDFYKGYKILYEFMMSNENIKNTGLLQELADSNTVSDNENTASLVNICNTLNLSNSIKNRCINLKQEYYNDFKHIMIKTYDTMIISYIVNYEQCMKKPSKKQICDTTNVCVPTLNKNIKMFQQLILSKK
ncbi:hypothetical protein [Heterosigma akashiwo virus 01]|jgi:transcription initiation factor TFIIIB Brf1 subunit/transcription initiation factor TFIIB|uniref:Transcription factor TFIIB cyclin-like domain-containing protein n=1 Tax=Heterosigma akashiwo virus 01 TaxID=97195 RepID=A0A1C9C520_HAV01|nr:hypothetical protein D1R72_gp054 [Heterosigma akashiwo virus 01]AOM63385.1 hypothetical protein [Heterosigma akashiwo virus 01]